MLVDPNVGVYRKYWLNQFNVNTNIHQHQKSMKPYHFITRWTVPATCREVYDILGEPQGLARWWPSVYLDVQILDPGISTQHQMMSGFPVDHLFYIQCRVVFNKTIG